MSINYCKGTKLDKSSIVDFANLVFSVAHKPHDFKELLPKLYSDRYDFSNNHFLCKKDGLIKSLVLLDKVNLKVGRHVIKVGCVGTVSVHPYERGNGYMKKLMTEVLSEIHSDCDLGELDGQRQRYEYFGFTPSGSEYLFKITSTNVRHALHSISLEGVTIKKVFRSNVDDLKAIREIVNSSSLLCEREGDENRLFDIMSSWTGDLFALYKDEVFNGYIYKIGSLVAELYVVNKELMSAFIKEFMLIVGLKEIQVKLNPMQAEYIKILSELSEEFSPQLNHNYLPVNIVKLITAFLELKASYSNLENGSVTIGINNEVFDIILDNGFVTVINSQAKPLVALLGNEVMQELFSVNSNISLKLDSLPSFAKNWFPLPLYMSAVDVC